MALLLYSCLQPVITTSDFCDPAGLNDMLKKCREDTLRACHELTVLHEDSEDTLLSGRVDNLWPLSPALFNKSDGGISTTGFNHKGKLVFQAVVNRECAIYRTPYPTASHFSSESIDRLLIENDTLEIFPWDVPMKVYYEPSSPYNLVISERPQGTGEIFSVSFFMNDKALSRYSSGEIKDSMVALITYENLALDQDNVLRIEVAEEMQPKQDYIFYVKLGCVPNGRCFDSLALLALQDSMPTPHFADKNKPLDKWRGIEIKDNRVVKIALGSEDEKISGFPVKIAYLSKLDTLRILSRHAHSGAVLPKEIGALHYLKALQLPNFTLAGLPPEIGRLKNLNVLELSIDSLPKAIGGLESLQVLRVRRLAHLPKEIQNLKNLQELDLKQHVLHVLPLELSQLHELKELILSGVEMPGTFGTYNIWNILYGLKQLEICVLRGMDLSLPFNNWEPATYDWLMDRARLGEKPSQSNLKVLDLSYTQFDDPPEFLCGPPTLEELYLEGNRLTFLPREIRNLKKLRILNLAANPIFFLPPELGGLPLQELNLSNNQLSEIPGELLSLSNLNQFSIDGNRLCDLPEPIRNWVDLSSNNPDWLNSQQCQSLPLPIDRILDSMAVRALYKWSSENNDRVGEWMFNETLETWPGITVKNGRVTGIQLEEKKVLYVPRQIRFLSKLETLQIPLKFIDTIPRPIFELENLKSLAVEELEGLNYIVIPEGIGSLLHVERFIVHNCASVPSDIGKLLKLKYLDLSKGKLSKLPLEITSLAPTEYFSINDNRLCDIPDTLKVWINTYATDKNWIETQTCK